MKFQELFETVLSYNTESLIIRSYAIQSVTTDQMIISRHTDLRIDEDRLISSKEVRDAIVIHGDRQIKYIELTNESVGFVTAETEPEILVFKSKFLKSLPKQLYRKVCILRGEQKEHFLAIADIAKLNEKESEWLKTSPGSVGIKVCAQTGTKTLSLVATSPSISCSRSMFDTDVFFKREFIIPIEICKKIGYAEKNAELYINVEHGIVKIMDGEMSYFAPIIKGEFLPFCHPSCTDCIVGNVDSQELISTIADSKDEQIILLSSDGSSGVHFSCEKNGEIRLSGKVDVESSASIHVNPGLLFEAVKWMVLPKVTLIWNVINVAAKAVPVLCVQSYQAAKSIVSYAIAGITKHKKEDLAQLQPAIQAVSGHLAVEQKLLVESGIDPELDSSKLNQIIHKLEAEVSDMDDEDFEAKMLIEFEIDDISHRIQKSDLDNLKEIWVLIRFISGKIIAIKQNKPFTQNRFIVV